ncbi:hypothetical protein DM01DRAFT_1291762, partial [Hesseltinella vesiculosa]
ELSSVLKILKTKAKDLSNDVKPMLEKLRSGEMQTSKGVSFLEVKYQVLLQYITELAIFAYAKLCGKQINGTDLIESLVELRVILERMKPIEAKLKYQVDKLVRNSVIGSKLQKKNKEATEDPLAFKPNPTGLLNMDGQDEQSENNESDEEELVSSNVYRPPKMAPVSYNELGSKKSKKEKDEQRMMERTSRSRMMKDLMVDMNDAPEESGVFGGVYDDIESGNVMDRKIADKTDYEENNYVRLQVTRKEKKHLRNRDRMLGSEFEVPLDHIPPVSCSLFFFFATSN